MKIIYQEKGEKQSVKGSKGRKIRMKKIFSFDCEKLLILMVKLAFFRKFCDFLLYFASVFEKILIDKVAISLAKFDVPAISAIFLGYSAGVE